jgi:hypothetical protein
MKGRTSLSASIFGLNTVGKRTIVSLSTLTRTSTEPFGIVGSARRSGPGEAIEGAAVAWASAAPVAASRPAADGDCRELRSPSSQPRKSNPITVNVKSRAIVSTIRLKKLGGKPATSDPGAYCDPWPSAVNRESEMGRSFFLLKTNQTRPLWPPGKNTPPSENIIEILTEGKGRRARRCGCETGSGFPRFHSSWLWARSR